MTNITPETKMPKLIVVMAFDRDEEGELQPAFDPIVQLHDRQPIILARTPTYTWLDPTVSASRRKADARRRPPSPHV